VLSFRPQEVRSLSLTHLRFAKRIDATIICTLMYCLVTAKADSPESVAHSSVLEPLQVSIPCPHHRWVIYQAPTSSANLPCKLLPLLHKLLHSIHQ